MNCNLNIVLNNNIEQTNILKGSNLTLKKEDNSSKITDDFFKAFIQTYVLAEWRYNIIARKHGKKIHVNQQNMIYFYQIQKNYSIQLQVYLLNTKRIIYMIYLI